MAYLGIQSWLQNTRIRHTIETA